MKTGLDGKSTACSCEITGSSSTEVQCSNKFEKSISLTINTRESNWPLYAFDSNLIREAIVMCQ